MATVNENTAAFSPRKSKQQRSRKTQEKILSATIETIAKKGFDGVSTHEIARKSGVKQSLVMYHFSSKEKLCWAAASNIIESFTEPFLKQLEAMEEVEPALRLQLLFHGFIEFSAKHPELHQFMIEANKHRSPEFHKMIIENVRPVFEFLREQIKQAQSAGAVIEGDPDILHCAMIGACATLFSLSVEFEQLTGKKASDKATVEGLKEVFAGFFFPRAPRQDHSFSSE